MAALVFVLACAGLAGLVGAAVSPLALWRSQRAAAARGRRSAAARADSAFVLGLAPALAALGVVGGTALPSMLTAAGLMADHCDDHGHHVHLCLVHASETPVWLTALGAVALTTFVIRALRLAATSLRRHRSMTALERLGTIDTRSRFPVVRVPGAPRLCLATGLFRRRVVYSASLAEHLPPAELAAALAHEAAHLRRRDTLSLGLLSLAGLFTFPGAAGRFRALFLSAAEEACDAEAAGEHGAETVARALVAAARLQLTVASGLGFTGNTLAARVAALLDAAAVRTTPARALAVALVLLAASGAAVGVFGLDVHHAVETVLSLPD
jgi:Zn-dependent protease with chaperone function